MSDAAKAVSRPMKYPYTHCARFAQFPYKHYWNHSWLARYWVYGTIASLPLIYSIHKMCKYLQYHSRDAEKYIASGCRLCRFGFFHFKFKLY